jgi:phytoene synthase
MNDGAMDPQLRLAYEECRRMHRRHDPTYYWATRWLPRHVRSAVHALYGYVRAADELVDGAARPASAEERRAALEGWKRQLDEGLAEGGSEQPVIAALVDAGRRHELPLGELDVYMRSMQRDCGPVRIQTPAELDEYMRGSAAAIGLIMAPLVGAPAAHRDGFGQMGVAFQLTNFVRDVREDLALDRVYLPREDLLRFEVTEDDLAGGSATPGFRALIALEVGRARSLFDRTAPAARSAAPEMRRGIELARNVYIRLLDRIEARGFDVLSSPTRLFPWHVGSAVLKAMRARP